MRKTTIRIVMRRNTYPETIWEPARLSTGFHLEEKMTKIESQPEIGKETGDSRPADLQALDNATFEPNGYIEQTGDFQQAEAIQTALTALVKPAVSAQDVGATPLPIPRPEDESIIGGQPKVRGDLDQATTGSEKSDATPINLPGPQPASTASGPTTGEADDLPVPIPSPGEQVSATPITLPGKPGANVDGSKVPTGEEVSATPITLPDKPGAAVDGSKIPTGEQVSATPITLPGKPGAGKAVLEKGPGRSGVAQDDWESPNAVRMQKGPAAVGEADDLPVPIPSPGVKETKAEPTLIPENNTASDAGSGGEADSLPIPMPSPKEASSGPAIDPSMDEQLKQRKEQAANDDDTPAGQ
jgi:hypothetical protein